MNCYLHCSTNSRTLFGRQPPNKDPCCASGGGAHGRMAWEQRQLGRCQQRIWSRLPPLYGLKHNALIALFMWPSYIHAVLGGVPTRAARRGISGSLEFRETWKYHLEKLDYRSEISPRGLEGRFMFGTQANFLLMSRIWFCTINIWPLVHFSR